MASKSKLETFIQYQQTKDRRLRDQLVIENLGLARTVAYRYSKTQPHNYDDFYQVCCLELFKVVDKFDPRRGTQFSTYAIPLLRGAVSHYCRDKLEIVRRRGSSKSVRVVSLDKALSATEGDGLRDKRLSEVTAAPDSFTEEKLLVSQLLEQLDEKSRRVIEFVFLEDLTQLETARRLGRAPITVNRQIKAALAKLKSLAL